jgi:uncharacterized protein (TIGR03790 family)
MAGHVQAGSQSFHHIMGKIPLAILLLFALIDSAMAATSPSFILPKASLGPEDLAVIVNERDPLSREIARYYQERRGIPSENVVRVGFDPGKSVMSRADFARIKAEVDRITPGHIQAFVLTWAAPYRVDCMSITSAFAFGFDEAHCAGVCSHAKTSAYYNSLSIAPFRDHGIRPAMVLAGLDFQSVKTLIDTGISADDAHPAGTAYLVSTGDSHRNVRAAGYPGVVKSARGWLDARLVEQEFITDKSDVLFYFTGRADVPGLDSLKFVPGAMADHLTSYGGMLTDSGQMSSLRWLEAGATGSYGTVVEPCNFPAKFPRPVAAMFWYLHGSTLIEAYWKSVAQPGQGIFIGEPLARPFGGYRAHVEGGDIVLRTQALRAGTYELKGSHSAIGPYQAESLRIVANPGRNEFRFRKLEKPIYRFERIF